MRRARRMPCVCGLLALAVFVHASTPAEAQSTTAAWPDRPASIADGSGASLFEDLVARTLVDFGRLPSRETLIWVSIGSAIAAFGHTVDEAATASLSRSDALDHLFEPGEVLGGARAQLAGAAATYAIGRFTSNRRVTQVGADLIRAQIVTQGVTAGIKMAVRRGRPDGTRFSFPSGHSSVTFASATVLQRHFGWKVGAPAYALATYVAASRVQEERHFLSDVAFGAAIGIAAGRTVTIGHGGRQFAVAPFATPGGGGLQLTWVGGE